MFFWYRLPVGCVALYLLFGHGKGIITLSFDYQVSLLDQLRVESISRTFSMHVLAKILRLCLLGWNGMRGEWYEKL